jgi:hypothetical protein
MDILVSFCNPQTPGRAALGLLDTRRSSFRTLALPAGPFRSNGVTGLASSDAYVYAVLQTGLLAPPRLLVLDRTHLALVNQYVFQSALDVHSLCSSQDALYVVSTGTDEVIQLTMHDAHVISEAAFWRPEPDAPRLDAHHLNAIIGSPDGLLASGFGKRAGPRWNSAQDGFIFNISTGIQVASGIYHPHSMVGLGRTLMYCESSNMAVRTIATNRIQYLPGYTRGLCVAEDKLFVGSSKGRKVSKSTGLINNPGESGVPAGRCTVSRLSLDSFDIEETIDLSGYGDEIYDLLAVEDTSRWPSGPVAEVGPLAQAWRHQVELARQDIIGLVPAGESFISVDAERWGMGDFVEGRRRLAFPERDGQYWGSPSDQDAAIRECERLRDAGATFIIFGWPAFWWLDYYAGFHRHLRATYPCILENDRLVVFDLRQ